MFYRILSLRGKGGFCSLLTERATIDAIILATKQSTTVLSISWKAIMANSTYIEVASSSDSKGGKPNEVDLTAEETEGQGARKGRDGGIPNNNLSNVAFVLLKSVATCINKLLTHNNFVYRVSNELFSFSNKKVLGKFLALPKAESKATSMETLQHR